MRSMALLTWSIQFSLSNIIPSLFVWSPLVSPRVCPLWRKKNKQNTLRMKSWSFLPDFLAFLFIYHFDPGIIHLLFDIFFNNLSKFSPCLDRVHLHFLPVKSLKFRNYRGKNICWQISRSTSPPPTSCFTFPQCFSGLRNIPWNILFSASPFVMFWEVCHTTQLKLLQPTSYV